LGIADKQEPVFYMSYAIRISPRNLVARENLNENLTNVNCLITSASYFAEDLRAKCLWLLFNQSVLFVRSLVSLIEMSR